MIQRDTPLSSRAVALSSSKLKNHASIERSARLTPREREVVSWLAQGKTIADTAVILNRSPKTIDVHRVNAARKLGTENRAELVIAAITEGIINCPCQLHTAYLEAA